MTQAAHGTEAAEAAEAAEATDAPPLSAPERVLAVAVGVVWFLSPISQGLKTGALLLAAAAWIGTGLVPRGLSRGVRQVWFPPLAAVVLLTFAGILWSPDRAMGLHEVRVAYHWPLAFAVASIPVSVRLFRHWASAFLAGVGVIVYLALLQSAGVIPLWKVFPTAFHRKIAFSLIVATALLLLVRRLATARGGAERALLALGFLAFWTALVLCKGRAGVVAFSLGLPAAALLLAPRSWDRRRKALLLALAAALFAATAAMPTVRGRFGEGVTEVEEAGSPQAEEGTTYMGRRLAFWKEGGRMFLEHPLLGVGTGGYGAVFRSRHPDFPTWKANYSAHSSYVSIAAELGLAGLAAWGALGFVLVREAWRRRHDEVGYSTLVFALVFLVGGLTDCEIQSGVMLCLAALLAGALSDPRGAGPPASRAPAWKRARIRVATFLGQALPTLGIYLALRLLRASLRGGVEGAQVQRGLHARGEPYIAAFWHSRLLMMAFIEEKPQMHNLISVHRDGDIVAGVLSRFGFGAVRGSSGTGGEGARAEMVRLLDSGTDIGIVVDGPKGPAEVAKPGVAWLCARTGRPVLPMAFSSSRALRLRTWDRLLVPRPFTRAVWLVGEPIRRRDGEDFEALRCRIEEAIREITARADALVALEGPGRPPR